MSVWIRTQFKDRLVLCDGFFATDSGMILGFQGPEDEDGIPLGTYDDQERAFEILNLLQSVCKKQFVTMNMPDV